jgi:hypothetical protein
MVSAPSRTTAQFNQYDSLTSRDSRPPASARYARQLGLHTGKPSGDDKPNGLWVASSRSICRLVRILQMYKGQTIVNPMKRAMELCLTRSFSLHPPGHIGYDLANTPPTGARRRRNRASRCPCVLTPGYVTYEDDFQVVAEPFRGEHPGSVG